MCTNPGSRDTEAGLRPTCSSRKGGSFQHCPPLAIDFDQAILRPCAQVSHCSVEASFKVLPLPWFIVSFFLGSFLGCE